MFASPDSIQGTASNPPAPSFAQVGFEVARAAMAGGNGLVAADGILDALNAALTLSGSALGIVRHTRRSAFFTPPAESEAASPVGLEWLAARGTLAPLARCSFGMDDSLVSLMDHEDAPVILDRTIPAEGIHHAAELSLLPPGCSPVVLNLGRQTDRVGIIALTSASPEDESAAREVLAGLAPTLTLALATLARERDASLERAQERMMLTALATLSQPVLMLDDAGTILDANAAAHAAYGYSPGELAGQVFHSLVAEQHGRPSPDSDTIGDTLPVWRGTPAFTPVVDGVWRSRERHRRKDGSEFPTSVVRAPVTDDAGRASGEVVIARDLTAEQQLEAHIRQHDRLAALGELVGGVAHELNNPLAGISAFAQLLLEDPLTDEQLESVRMVKREADRAAAVVRDLLLFARRTGSRMTALDLNELVRATVRLRAYHFRSRGVELELDLDESLPYINGDQQKLQQVLLHLLGNAEDALGDDGQKVIRVRTFVEGGGGGVTMEVQDTGRGMSAQALAHAFDPFFTTKHAGAGTGLGLSVSYGIVEAHGGMLSVDSVPGRFTTVRVQLPCPRESAMERDG